MKQLTGTVNVPTSGLSVTPIAPIVTTATSSQESLIRLFPSLKNKDGNPLVTPTQANELVSLHFKNGEQILDLKYDYFIYEVINMLYRLDYDVVKNFLSTDWENIFESAPGVPISKIRSKMIFENPLMKPAKEKFALDMEIFRDRVDVSKGAVDCKKCGSDQTISIEKQIRSADEPMSIRVTCVQCRYTWIAQ